MSILVKGMKMPKDCDSCWLSRMHGSSLGGILDCKILGTVGAAMDDPHDILNNRHPDCPLIELPKKHGRLIDADVLAFNLDGVIAVSPTGYIHGDMVADMIGDASTIIEAEEDDR